MVRGFTVEGILDFMDTVSHSTVRMSNPESHWAFLSLTRFFLAACVALGHFALFVRTDPTHLFGAGYFNPGSAVFGFMILSGYSIAASLGRDSKGFYPRRIVRIWPLYLATIATGLALSIWLPSGFRLPLGGAIPGATTLSVVASVLMLQTIIGSPVPMVGQIWSLSPEWWHYMAAPLLKRIPTAFLLAWSLVSLIAFLRIAPPPGHGIEAMSHGFPMLLLSWQWVTGFVYYRLRGTALGFAVLALPSVFAATVGHFTGPPLFIAIFALVLSEQFELSKKVIRFFNFLGDYSFPLYLFHIPAMIIALALGSNRTAITLAVMGVVPLIALYAVDYPSRSLFKRKTHQAVGTSPHSALAIAAQQEPESS